MEISIEWSPQRFDHENDALTARPQLSTIALCNSITTQMYSKIVARFCRNSENCKNINMNLLLNCEVQDEVTTSLKSVYLLEIFL